MVQIYSSMMWTSTKEIVLKIFVLLQVLILPSVSALLDTTTSVQVALLLRHRMSPF